MQKKWLGLSLLFSLSCSAQGPGGITTGLKMWLKADALSSFNLDAESLVNSWAYANDNAKSFTSTSSMRPRLVANTFNFKPAVLFSRAQEMIGPHNSLAPLQALDDDYSVFVVWQGVSKTGFRIWEQWGCVAASHSGASFAFQTGNGVSFYGAQFDIKDNTAPGFGKIGNQPFTFFEPLISQINLYNQKINDLEIVDNKQYNAPKFTTIDRDFRFLSDKGNVLGRRCTNTDEPFDGYLAELIVFDRPITGIERDKVFSYLSFKYGLPLKTTGAPPSYYASDWNGITGTNIWSGAANALYTNDLFGIGRDDNSGFYQSIANSMNSGAGDGTGQSGKGNIIISNPANLDHLEFLIIGHNNAVLSEQATDMPSFTKTEARRLSREWKVQRTGDPGAVQLSFDLTGIVTTGEIAQTVMIIDEDGDGNFTTGHVSLITPTARDGNRVIFENVTLENNQVFTFITKVDFWALPVQSLHLKVSKEKEYLLLKWVSIHQDSIAGYDIEVSNNGRQFTKLMEVPAGNQASYNMRLLPDPEKGCFYRVKEKYFNRQASYSNTVCALLVNEPVKAIAFPNPFQDQLYIDFAATTNGLATLKMLNSQGAILKSLNRPVTKGSNRINLTPYVPVVPGIYTVHITLENETQTLKVFKR